MGWVIWPVSGTYVFSDAKLAACPTVNLYSPIPNSAECTALNASDWLYPLPGTFVPGDLGFGDAPIYIGAATDSLPPPSGFAGASAPGGGSTVVEFGAPFNLSVEDGVLVGGAIAGVWLLAFVFRALRTTLGTDGYGGHPDD